MSKFTTFSGGSDEAAFLSFLKGRWLLGRSTFAQTATYSDSLGQATVALVHDRYNFLYRKTTDGLGYKLFRIAHA
jgi:hypothetical protein